MMKQQTLRHPRIIFLCLLTLLLFGCGKEEQAPAPAAPTKAKKADATKVAAEGVLTTPEVPVLKYVYVTEGRRDPFQPFLLVNRPVDAEADLSAQTPLQQYDAQQYKLSAIIVGYGEPMAMVSAPDGKSYVVRKGVKIGKNGGTVIKISKDSFYIEEKFRDFSDEVRTNLLEIKLPKREGV